MERALQLSNDLWRADALVRDGFDSHCFFMGGLPECAYRYLFFAVSEWVHAASSRSRELQRNLRNSQGEGTSVIGYH